LSSPSLDLTHTPTRLPHVVPAATESPPPEAPFANVAPSFVCPHCGAAMSIVEIFARGATIRAPPTLRAAASAPALGAPTIRPLCIGHRR